MATLTIPYDFVPNTLIDPSEMNANFDAIKSFVESQVIHADGSTPFAAVPVGPASDPVSDNQYARKRYVDGDVLIATGSNANLASGSSSVALGGWSSVIERGGTISSTSITVTNAGVYDVGGIIGFGVAASGIRGLRVQVNGSDVRGLNHMVESAAIGTIGTRVEVGRKMSLSASSVITALYFQNSGGDLAATWDIWAMRIN